MKVYILSTYEEYGAENVMATTDASRVPAMLEQLVVKLDWGKTSWDGFAAPQVQKAMEEFGRAMEKERAARLG